MANDTKQKRMGDGRELELLFAEEDVRLWEEAWADREPTVPRWISDLQRELGEG